MATKLMTVLVRRGTTAEWQASDRVLASGEIGCNTETGEYRLGNGTTPWSGLNSVLTGNIGDSPGLVGLIQDTVSEMPASEIPGSIDGNVDGLVTLTQSEYDALATKSPTTLYVVVDGDGTPSPMSQEAGVWLDSFDGATDDDKLDAALAYQEQQTYIPPILLGARNHVFTKQRIQKARCMRILGVGGFNNTEKGVAFEGNKAYMGTRVSLTLAEDVPWIPDPSLSQAFGLSLWNIAFYGSGKKTTVFGGGSTVWWCDSLRDLSFSGMRTVFGTQATKRLITACVWDGGGWDIGNSYNGAVHIGGSDNTLWPDGGLIDSGIAYAADSGITNQYHLWFDSLEKTYVGPIFVTAEGAWGGIRITGINLGAVGNNLGSVQLHGAKIEGRSPTQASNGNLIRVEGGMLHAKQCWIAYGMISPTTPGRTPQDAGLVHVTQGGVSLDTTTFHKASGQAETVPCVYQAAGEVRVRDTWAGSRTAAWTGKPGVKSIGGVLVNDGTMTVLP